MTSTFLHRELELIRGDVTALFSSSPELLGVAKPPTDAGVYMLLEDKEIVYVGETRGTNGLRNRFNNHISGDDTHAAQGNLKLACTRFG
jgi:hypothetical protein